MFSSDDSERERRLPDPGDAAGMPHASTEGLPVGPSPSLVDDRGLYDDDTSLPGRLLFWDRVEQALAWGDRHGGRLAVLLFDVSDVDRVNGRLGADARSQLMRQIGRRLVGALRKQDTVARTGDREFGVLLPEVDSATGAATVAHKVLRLFERHFDVFGHSVGVTPSIGAAVYPDHAFTLEALLGGAGVAKSVATDQGRGVFLVYAPGMSRRSPMMRLREAGDG